ncbi:(5-formylfuran-3-yl)methyl phosphate synthase [Methylibium sp.]|uniref:(5-formylfuran-3-yl)methyl phosphate synthase n=1 Tax=Methylibium sp. TaxID=2067992 RepID=UPI003D10FB2B
MKLLVSVRSVDEALAAAAAGADFIDLKEPSGGALGALPLATTEAIVAALQRERGRRPISATIGDCAGMDAVLDRVAATAACGVDYVKVGVAPGQHALLDALAVCGHAVVPVFIADHGIDTALLARAGALAFPALMLDTDDKARGSLFDLASEAQLRRFVTQVRRGGKLCGLAGALRFEHLPRLQAIAPDFAGFRSAVCNGARTAALDPQRVRALRDRLQCEDAAQPA